MKKFVKFTLILLPWFLSSLTPIDKNYYKNLNLPWFAPPSIAFGIIWTILYISITISIYKIINNNNKKDIPNSYKYTLILNYIANQSFQPLFFYLKNNDKLSLSILHYLPFLFYRNIFFFLFYLVHLRQILYLAL